MTPELPESETKAHQCLAGSYDAGNWKPAAAVTVALACIRNGITDDGYLDIVYNSHLGELLLESTEFTGKPGKLKSFLRARYLYAEEIYEPYGGGDIREQARELMLRVLWADCWPSGKQGTSVRAVALALVAVVIERGAYSFDCSARWLAAQAGLPDPKKASEARKALAELGLIEVTGKGRALRRVKVNLMWRVDATTTNKSFVCSRFVQRRSRCVLTARVGASSRVGLADPVHRR